MFIFSRTLLRVQEQDSVAASKHKVLFVKLTSSVDTYIYLWLPYMQDLNSVAKRDHTVVITSGIVCGLIQISPIVNLPVFQASYYIGQYVHTHTYILSHVYV